MTGDPLWVEGRPFEQAIDGYFPLHTSLRHMLDRNGFSAAVVTLSYAPIMHIPDLPPDSPVPLNIRSGHAGLIGNLSLCVTQSRLCGFGHWRWFSPDAGTGDRLSPLTRLAEPAFVEGVGLIPGRERTGRLGMVRRSAQQRVALFEHPPASLTPGARIWGPFGSDERIDYLPPGPAAHGERGSQPPSGDGLVVMCRDMTAPDD